MDGPTIVRALLLARPTLVSLLGAGPEKSAICGVLPESAPLPAVGISEVSAVEFVPLAGGPQARVTSRVQLTVVGKTYRQAKDLMSECKFACRNFVGTAPTSTPTPGATCHLENTGPDFEAPGGFVTQTQDVTVTFQHAP
jgi:hypothetical protein